MTFQGDPHRTLGIPPGASLNEIRAAYRRLVKQYHPDAAGERALPRFLAIQAAYELLVDGEGRLRPVRTGSARRGAGTASRGAGDPWRADPGRARASRDAWRARRGAGADGGEGVDGAAGGWAGPGTGSPRPRTGSAGPRAKAGARDAAGPGGTRAGERAGRRGPRKATPGSTTYDDAAESPRDPAWAGGAWYGPSSGTYWTLNPREYADPRKHGPEYLARARRAQAAEAEGVEGVEGGWAAGAADAAATAADQASAAGVGGEPATGAAPEPTPETDAEGRGGRWRWSGAGPTTTDGGAAEWGARSWTYDPARPGGTAWTEGAADHRRGDAARRRPADAPSRQPDAPPLPDLEILARRAAPLSLLALARRSDPRWRLAVALVGWPAMGFAAGSLVSMINGCSSFSAACPEPMPLLSVAVQPLVIAGLFLVPAAAAVTAFASIVALAVALPIAAVLSVGTVPESRVGAPVLGVLTAAAYLVALAIAAVVVWRSRTGEDVPGP